MSRSENESHYERLIATIPELTIKGKKFLYTAVNGHMFTYLDPEGTLGIRLSKEDKQEFEKSYQTGPFKQYGAVMQGYVTIPQGLLENTEELAPYLQKSMSFIKTLQPK